MFPDGTLAPDTLFYEYCLTGGFDTLDLQLTTSSGDTIAWYGWVNGAIYNQTAESEIDLNLSWGEHTIFSECNVAGCQDKIVIIIDHLYNPPTEIDTGICAGESYQVGNSVYTSSGMYSDTLTGSNGCDSIVNLWLWVHPTFEIDIVETICDGESVTVGNNVYTTTGVYNHSYQTTHGCDSLITLDLTVLPSPVVSLNETICDGESFTVGNSTYTTTGDYVDVLQTTLGCDSTVHLWLDVLPNFTTTIDSVICDVDSIYVGGNWYDSTGTYTINLTATNGCDSTITLNLVSEFCDPCEGYYFESDHIILPNSVTYYIDPDSASCLTLEIGIDAVDSNVIIGGYVNGEVISSPGTWYDDCFEPGEHWLFTTGCHEDCVDTIQILIVAQGAIAPPYGNHQLKVMGNPIESSGVVRVRSATHRELDSYTFFSSSGVVIERGNWIDLREGVIDLSSYGSLPGGVYYLKASGFETEKIVIVRD